MHLNAFYNRFNGLDAVHHPIAPIFHRHNNPIAADDNLVQHRVFQDAFAFTLMHPKITSTVW
jgi:hypothetical protein